MHSFYSKGAIMVDQRYYSGRADLLMNVSNLFRHYSPDRFYNLIPHAGIGYIHAGDAPNWKNVNISQGSVVYGGGLMNTFRLTGNLSAYLNLAVYASNFDKPLRAKPNEGMKGFATASAGLIYAFGERPGKTSIPEPPAPPTTPTPPTPPPTPPTPPTPPPTPPTPPVVQPPAFTPIPVFFRLGQSVIDSDQQANIAIMANYLRANPNARAKVVGYADQQTGSPATNYALSERRARNVAQSLIDRYNIDRNRITIEWRGDREQPYPENARNRVVIMLSE
jgi:outer membrane protein OmpA-like peptidoglycan-associated protein